MKRLTFRLAMLWLLLAGAAQAQQHRLEISVSAGSQEYRQVPVLIPLSVPKSAADFTTAQLSLKGKGTHIDGQVTAPSIVTESIASQDRVLVRRDLHFVLEHLKMG